MNTFAVVQDVFRCDNWQTAADLLVELFGAHPTTAKQQARKCGGFLAENLADNLAERLRAECAARGLLVHVVPQRDVVVLPKAVRTHQIWFNDVGLLARATHADPLVLVPWDRFLLLAVARGAKTESYESYSTDPEGISFGSESGIRLTTERKTREIAEQVADLYFASPDSGLERRRLSSREVNLDAALGDDKPDSLHVLNARLAGFHLLLARIGNRAPQAIVPLPTLALLGSAPPQRVPLYKLQDLADFDAYNRWLLQCQRSGFQKTA